MGLVVKFNPAQLEANIENLARIAGNNASRTMRRAAIRIRDLAREYAPDKTGALVESIKDGVKQGPNRRNVYIVYVDTDMSSGDNKQVGDYAWIMEEQLKPYGRQRGPKRYTLGPGSQVKAAGGFKVGGKFLKRAVDEGTRKLVEEAAAEVRKSMGGRRSGVQYERETYGDDE